MAITRLAWVLTVVALATTAFASAQTIPELAKARPANPVVRGILQDIPALSIDELTKGAAIVAEGVISHERSYLTPDEQHIQTDFQIIPSRVIAARLQVARSTPGQPPPLTLAVTGGKYTVDGFTVYEVDHNRENSKVGGRYLLFLKPSRQAGKYQLYAVGPSKLTMTSSDSGHF
jgi:hypothetical protein